MRGETLTSIKVSNSLLPMLAAMLNLVVLNEENQDE
jgi:hypothetical protein